MMRRPGFAFAGSLVALGIGCSLVTSYDDLQGGGAPSSECGRGIPARPSAGTAGGGDLDLFGVMSEARFFDQAGKAPLGYDLDGLCTCAQRNGKAACKAAAGPGKPCDDPATEGVDNAAGNLIKALLAGAPSQTLAGGDSGLALRVKGYNGKADDADVEVSLFNAAAVKTPAGGPAAFDGKDVVTVDTAGLVTPQTFGSAYIDTNAYVTGGVLVASFTKFTLRIVIPDTFDAGIGTRILGIPLAAATLVGRIQVSGAGTLQMPDAQLVGRVPLGSIFEQVGKFGICADGGAFEQVKQITCSALDLPTSPQADGTDATCDALSFAYGVTIVGAKLGGAAAVTSTPSPCGAAPTVSCGN